MGLGAYIQGNIEREDIRSGQQLIEGDIAGASTQLGTQFFAIVVLNLHPKAFCLLCHIAANTPHSQNPQRLASGIVTQRDTVFELSFPQPDHKSIERFESSKDKKHARVSRSIICEFRDIAYADPASCTVGNVDGIISRSILTEELEGAGHGLEQFLINDAGDVHGGEGSEYSHHTIEGVTLSFSEEVCSIGSLDGDDFCDFT